MTKFNDPSFWLQLIAILVGVNIIISTAVGGLVLANMMDLSGIKASRWTSQDQAEFEKEEFIPLKYKVNLHHPVPRGE